ncbi:Hsp70 family protein [Clostridium sp. DL1XJH146]
MSKIIGIDLGTSTSEIAIMEDGEVSVLKDNNGEVIIPSIVGLDDNGNIIVGEKAKEQFILRPEYTVREVKRLMGSDEKVTLGESIFTPEKISAFILENLKAMAEDILKSEVNRAVITVPAYFTDEQRRATVKAGELAGLKVERIINEPTAAALSYGIENMENEEHILVYDLGGGTLDVTILEMFDGVLEVKASSGNNHLGGKDFDEAIMNELFQDFEKEYSIDLRKDLRSSSKIKEEAEKCKIKLSSEEEYSIEIPFIAEKDGKPLSLIRTFTKIEFEELIKPLINSTEKPINIALKDSDLTPDDIDVILLVGGSTRIPIVKEFLKEKLNKEPKSYVDPDLAVVKGAAIQGAILNEELSVEKDILITDVCPYTLGIEVLDYIGGMPVPDCYSVLIKRNTTIPTMKEETYYTAADNQEMVEIKVYQGDNKKASSNNFIGNFMLTGIPKASAGNETVKVKFNYDVNGILNVEATINSTGEKAGITIETTGVSMEEEIDVSSWEEAPKAKKYKRTIEKAEKLFFKLSDTIDRQDLEEAINELKKALIKEEDDELLKKVKSDLTDLMFELEE